MGASLSCWLSLQAVSPVSVQSLGPFSSAEVSLCSFPPLLDSQVDVFSELHLISDQSKQYLKMGLLAVDQHIHAGYDASTFTMTGEASGQNRTV